MSAILDYLLVPHRKPSRGELYNKRHPKKRTSFLLGPKPKSLSDTVLKFEEVMEKRLKKIFKIR